MIQTGSVLLGILSPNFITLLYCLTPSPHPHHHHPHLLQPSRI